MCTQWTESQRGRIQRQEEEEKVWVVFLLTNFIQFLVRVLWPRLGCNSTMNMHDSTLSMACSGAQKKRSLFACLQIPALPSHCGAVLPELLTAHQWRVGHGCGGTLNLERRAASHGPDQMGLSAAVWLIPFLLVKVYHSYGTMDSAGPLGSVCSGFIPGGESLKITWTWELDVEVCFIQWITERYEIPPLAMEHES